MPELQAKVCDVLEASVRSLEQAHRSGVKLVFGTDLLGHMHDQQLNEFAIRGEMQSPVEVIRSATSTAAEMVQKAGEIGVIAAGARADMLVLDGDPLRVLQNPPRFLKAIVKDGKFYKDEITA